jgi:nucleoside-triphosphatase
MSRTTILLTGRPGIGKTTLLQTVCRELRHCRPTGFYTLEIRQHGIRQGFELVGLDHRRMTLAHRQIAGQGRVGTYGVDIQSFEAFLDELNLDDPDAGFTAIDEIGKMECLSPAFVLMVGRILDSARPCLATVAAKGGGFIQEVKARGDVQLVTLNEENRESLTAELVRRMNSMLG